MAKHLEDFVKEHRHAMDANDPPSHIWERIAQRGPFHRPGRVSWIWKAASVLLLGVCTVLVVLLIRRPNDQLSSLGDLSKDYRKLEQQYVADITTLQENLKTNDIDSVEYKWLFDEIRYLEEVNQDFRADIGTSVDQDKLVAALIDYYEKKMRLLKKLELEINRRNNEQTRIANI